MLLFLFLTLPSFNGWDCGLDLSARSSLSKLGRALSKLGRGAKCLRPMVLIEDGAREGEIISGSHDPFDVDSCRNVGREEGGLWMVEVLNGGLNPSLDPGRRSVLLLPVTYTRSSESVEEEGGRNTLWRDEEVDGRRSGVTTSTELNSVGPEALVRATRDLVDEGESVVTELEDRDGRGMWVGECELTDENTRLDWGSCGDSARRGGFSGGGTGEPLDREDAVSMFGGAEG